MGKSPHVGLGDQSQLPCREQLQLETKKGSLSLPQQESQVQREGRCETSWLDVAAQVLAECLLGTKFWVCSKQGMVGETVPFTELTVPKGTGGWQEGECVSPEAHVHTQAFP